VNRRREACWVDESMASSGVPWWSMASQVSLLPTEVRTAMVRPAWL
jgi:hypothetical protein